jgi:maleylpyruvate isomerase
MMKLHSYFRSSASFRVRIALNLKELKYEYVPVHLLKSGGGQFTPLFRALNPAALVPVLEDGTQVLTQSLAILEYLEEKHPEPALLPRDPVDRARVRALALAIACEIHPLNNLRVLRYLVRTLGVDKHAKNTWYRHWVEQGLSTVEAMLADDPRTGHCCHGDTPTLADCCLVPQICNAQRFECRLDHVRNVMRVFEHCMTLPAFQQAAPEKQPDAE